LKDTVVESNDALVETNEKSVESNDRVVELNNTVVDTNDMVLSSVTRGCWATRVVRRTWLLGDTCRISYVVAAQQPHVSSVTQGHRTTQSHCLHLKFLSIHTSSTFCWFFKPLLTIVMSSSCFNKILKS